MGSALRYERGLRVSLLWIVVVLVGCPVEEAHPRNVSGVGGEPTDFMGAGGAPPLPMGGVGGMAGSVAGGVGGGQPPAGNGGSAGTIVPAGSGGAPVGGEGGMGPIMNRVFDAGMAPDRNNVQAGALCQRLAEIQCAGEEYCCEDPGRDRATCEDAMLESCKTEAYLDAISGNEITAFNEETAAVTFAEVERLASVCSPDIVSFSISRDGFMAMFRGTASAGASCFPSGTNAAVAAAKLASCTDIGTIACLPTSLLSWKCTERGGAGDPCFTDVNCFDGLYCPNDKLEIGKSSCEARKPIGGACRWGNECESLFCEAGACVPPSQRNAYCLKLSE
jgi:hypothetical protein